MFFIVFVLTSNHFSLTNQRLLGSSSTPNMGAAGILHREFQGAALAGRAFARIAGIFPALSLRDLAGATLG
jgi:hypothetical protein